MEWTDGGGEWGSDGEGEREGGVRERGGVKEGGEVRERGGSEVCSWFVGAHRPWARIGCGHTWFMGTHGSWVCMGSAHGFCAWVVGMHGSWARMVHGCGHVSVRGVYQSGVGLLLAVHARHAWVGGCRVRTHSSFVVAGHCRAWVGCCCLCRMVFHGWWGGGLSWSLGVVAWVSFVGAGCCSWALGALCGCWASYVGAGSFVGCGLWALGLLRVRCTLFCCVRLLLGVMSLLGMGSLLGARSWLRAVMVLGLSWYEHGGMGIPTYRDVGAK